MHLLLLLLAVALAGAGLAMLRFAVPVEEFAGAALFMSGVVSLVGALVMGGLAAAVHKLGRIAERLEIQPMPLPPTASVERDDPAPRAARTAPATPTAPRPSLLGWLNRGGAAPPRSQAAPSTAAIPTTPALAQPTPAPSPDIAPPARVESGPVFTAPTPAPPVRPPVRPAVPPSAAPSGSGGNTVYRSGVIDGMAYTLFMDGSIQAELPQGTQKFASVDDLQKYLVERR